MCGGHPLRTPASGRSLSSASCRCISRSTVSSNAPLSPLTRHASSADTISVALRVSAYEAAASEVISFYAARLQESVGHGFQVATLAFYAEYWTHSSSRSLMDHHSPTSLSLTCRVF